MFCLLFPVIFIPYIYATCILSRIVNVDLMFPSNRYVSPQAKDLISKVASKRLAILQDII
jgi:hypothetical protein